MDSQTVNIIVIAISMGFSAFFSSADAAFLSLQGSPRLQHLVSTSHPGARRISSMLDQPEKLLSTILLGNNLMNILFATLMTVVMLSFIDDETVTAVTRRTHFVPETKRVAELFEELRESGSQMAIVVDEFGGLARLVTLKRLLEELTGPVGDEGEAPEEEYEAIDEFTFQVDGAMSIDEANEKLGLDLPEGDFETVAGFVLDVLGHIPSAGERLEYGGLRLEVFEMKSLKVESVRLVKPPDTTVRDV